MQSINSLNINFYGYTFKIIIPFKLLSCLQNPNCLNISFREIFMKSLNSECQIQHLGSKAYGWYLSPFNIHIHHFFKKNMFQIDKTAIVSQGLNSSIP